MSRRHRHPSLSESSSTSHSFNILPNHTHSILTMYASTFAFGALQLLVLAASALPIGLTSRDDYYGDVRTRIASPHECVSLTSGFHYCVGDVLCYWNGCLRVHRQ